MIFALLDRLILEMGDIPTDARLITATIKAGIDNLEKIQKGQPADAQDMLLSTVTEALCRKLHLKNGGFNISAACAAGSLALARGAAMIASGMCDAVLVCGVDLVTEFVFSGFSCLGALSSRPCMPFDRQRDGMNLGEGAAALLLMSPARARREKRAVLGVVAGWGSASDAAHITAPARDGSGLILAISRSLKRAGLNPDDISAICAHGTGTVHNDAMELTAFNALFTHSKPPVFSIKGAVGHPLGAAGVLEAAVGLCALSDRMIPPTVGLVEAEPVAKKMVQPVSAAIHGDALLSTNSGFGGINAAVILKKGGPA